MGWKVTNIVEKVDVWFTYGGRLTCETIHTHSRREARKDIKRFYPEAKIVKTEPIYKWERN